MSRILKNRGTGEAGNGREAISVSPFPRFFVYILVMLFAALLTATGCANNKVPKDTLIIAGADAVMINPILSADSASSLIEGFVFDSLITVDDNLNFIPRMARKWEVSKDGRVWTFYLKKGIKWHDGVEFTAEDVRFTIESIMNPGVNSPRKSDYELIQRIETPDPYTIKIRLREPYAPFLASMSIGIIPKHILEKEDINTAKFNRKPVGTGPYKFKEWKSAEYVALEVNEGYFDKIPKIKKIKVKVIPDMNIVQLQERTGEVDVGDILPKDYELMKQVKGLNTYLYDAMAYTYLGFNLQNPQFQDVRVRQAISYAVDRNLIVDKVLHGIGSPAGSPISPLSWAYNPEVKPYSYDPQRARQLLAEAGWKDTDGDGILDKDGKPFKFVLMTNKGNKTREDLTVILQQQLKEVGISAEPRIIEWSTFIANYVNKKNYDVVILGWSLGVDPDNYSIFHSSQIKDGLNFISYRNPRVDRLLEEGRTTIDQGSRKKIYGEFQKIMAEDQPLVFLYYPKSITGVRDRVAGVRPPSAAGLFLHEDEWYIKN